MTSWVRMHHNDVSLVLIMGWMNEFGWEWEMVKIKLVCCWCVVGWMRLHNYVGISIVIRSGRRPRKKWVVWRYMGGVGTWGYVDDAVEVLSMIVESVIKQVLFEHDNGVWWVWCLLYTLDWVFCWVWWGGRGVFRDECVVMRGWCCLFWLLLCVLVIILKTSLMRKRY